MTSRSDVRKFSLLEIEESTENFKTDLIGKGGFGEVFKGLYHGTAIAVKKLNPVRPLMLQYYYTIVV